MSDSAQRQLRPEQARWFDAGDLTSVPTPPSIQALLAARIERLLEGERAMLQRASVVGKVFWWGAVPELSPTADREQVGAWLQALVRRELIRPDESLFADQDAFRFRQILIRDAAYASLPEPPGRTCMKKGNRVMASRAPGFLEQLSVTPYKLGGLIYAYRVAALHLLS